MKMLKTLFSSLLLLVVCQTSQAQATQESRLPVYQNLIADISLGIEDSMLAGDLTLDNGLVLHIVDYKTRDDNVMKTWSAGDVVSLNSEIKGDQLLLTAKRLNQENDSVEVIAILDVTREPIKGLRIVEVTDGGKFVKLSDGSVWAFSWLHKHYTTSKWHAAEHVIVQGDGQANGYDFINVDAPIQDNAHHAKGSFVVN